MAYPLGPGAHIDVPLSNFASVGFNDPVNGLVGQALVPEIAVSKQSDKFYIIEKGAFFRVPSTLRAPRTKANRVNFEVSSSSYFADNYALATDNALEDLENADMAINLRQNGTSLVVGNLRLDEERRIANMVTSITNVGSGVALTGTAKWSDYAGSDPVADVTTGHAFIRSNTGLIANTAVIDWDTLMVLRRHPVLLDMYKYTSGGEVSTQQIADVFKVPNIMVAHGVLNTAIEGAADSMSNVWGNCFVMAHVGATTGLRSTTFAGRFRWRNPIFPADFAVQTAMFNRAGEEKVEVLEAGYFQDEQVIARDLAYTINDTL